MSNGYSQEDLEAILESLESDESDESDEAVRRRPFFRPPATAPGRGLVPPKPQAGFVTEARLEAALARVGAQIKTNADAIKAVNGRLNTVSADISRQAAALKKETEERKKEINGLKNTVQLSALLPLLMKQESVAVPADSTLTQFAGKKVVVESTDSLTALLPILLLGGLGTPSEGATAGAGGLGDPMTMMLVVLAASGKL
jgi:hypothetical protein